MSHGPLVTAAGSLVSAATLISGRRIEALNGGSWDDLSTNYSCRLIPDSQRGIIAIAKVKRGDSGPLAVGSNHLFRRPAMRLHLLGTTGYHPNNQRQTACLMVPESGLVLDAGTAMFRVRDHLITETLDIFLTHAHLDHVVGLTFLHDVFWERAMRQVVIHGVAEKLAAIQTHLFSEALFPAPLRWEYRPLGERVELPDGGIVTHFPLDHPGGSTGFRVSWPGRSLAYVTDTTARLDATYVQHIRDVDLLVHECTFPDGCEDRAQFTGHSCTTPVAQVAAAAHVKRLVLVHVNPMLDSDDPLHLASARRIFPATVLADDQMVVEF